MVSTIVHLLRHGEVHNPDGVLYGRIPGYHLSERGHEMARRVAAHLAGEPGPDGTSRPRADHEGLSRPPSRVGPAARSRGGRPVASPRSRAGRSDGPPTPGR